MIPRSPMQTPVPRTLGASFQFCRAVARHHAHNFYYSFLLLPPHLRQSMCALYAFMRRTDDLADGPGAAGGTDRAEQLQRWRHDVERAL